MHTLSGVTNLLFFPPVLGDEQEYRLTRYLMANYDPSVRPAENASEPLKVVFGISLHHIIDVVSTHIISLFHRAF